MERPSELQTTQPVILFDGVCNFCNAGINFIIRQDKKKVFRFAALQSEAGQKLLKQYNVSQQEFKSFLLLENGKLLQKSTAGLQVFGQLPWWWKWTQIGWMAPRFLRDRVYDFIARNRYKWFGKRDNCIIPTAEVRSRFVG